MESNLRYYESNQSMFAQSVEQPLIVAVRSAQPATAPELLNLLPKESQRVVLGNMYGGYSAGRTALDIVRASLRALRAYEGEKDSFFPNPLQRSYRSRFFGYNPSSTNNIYMEPRPTAPRELQSFLSSSKRVHTNTWLFQQISETGLPSTRRSWYVFRKKRRRSPITMASR